MRTYLLALLLLAGCGSQDQGADNQAGSETGPVFPPSAGLTGLYEGGSAAQPDQLCMIDEDKAPARFGLVVWGANDHSCLGAGEAVREGDRLRLTMAGDSTCRIDARIEGDRIVLPADVPEGCAYYCGARARFAARTLTRKGADAAAARKATDLAGDPLC
ncbi:MAG TPA: hypothetical protein VK472_03155 [Allosphingosinicella sp.]|nr:hypothetical protein [Allosphingosinicella sp.]